MRLKAFLFLLILIPPARALASAALLLEEPFGRFGYLNPTGHAAVYLSNVCAESPTRLRLCRRGEPGVVISRYHKVDGLDWVAIPLIPYLYAVDSPEEIPQTADRRQETDLRDAWRRKHLESIAPDTNGGGAPAGEWIQLVGSLYDRKIFAFEVDTKREQDLAFIDRFNAHPNRSHFNLFFNNCADFSRRVLDFYFPRALRRSYSADLGLTTPKQMAASLVRYSGQHEQIQMKEYVLPQVPGSIPRSRHVDGVVEAMLRKKYILPVAILQPYFAAGLALTYLTGGRFDPSKHAVPLNLDDMIQALSTAPVVSPRRRQPGLIHGDSSPDPGSMVSSAAGGSE